MRRSSTTFFYSSVFFPGAVREDVLTLYAFVRTADDLVDNLPQDRDGFARFCDEYRTAAAKGDCSDEVVSEFAALAQRRGIRPEWVESFLWAMGQDLEKSVYLNIAETQDYMYGSAETVGMMMARIMELPDESLPCARALGRAFQYVNFIRDVKEDSSMGRLYLPLEELLAVGLAELTDSAVRAAPDAFERFIRDQLARYHRWVQEASDGYRFIPRRALGAIRTAVDMYNYTADVIAKRPAVVMERKVKPGRLQVIGAGVKNLARAVV